MDKKREANNDLLNSLFKHCLEQATGTLFIATEDNRSCQIVLKQGALTKVSYGQDKDHSALNLLKSLNTGRYSFSSNLILPMDDAATIENSAEALNFLGFEKYLASHTPAEQEIEVAEAVEEIESEADRMNESSTDNDLSSTRQKTMYRGREVKAIEAVEKVENEANSTRDSSNNDQASKKPKRMYRGREIK